MKKHYLLLFFFMSLLGYSQQVDINGAKSVKIINPPALSAITANVTNVTGVGLSDGTIILNPISGGTPSSPGVYAINWTNIANPTLPVNVNALTAGTYRVRATDANGCYKEQDFTIYQPDLITVSINPPSLITCYGNNGSLTAVANGGYPYGGTPNYTYSWYKCTDINGANPTPVTSAGAQLNNNTKAGFYMVNVVDNKNATIAKAVVELKQADQLDADQNIVNVVCFGDSTGSIKVTPKGGTGPQTIVWDDNAAITSFERTGLNAGIYKYTIFDPAVPGCSSVKKTATVLEPNAELKVTSSIKQPTLANNDGQIVLTASGGIIPGDAASYTYQWSKVGDPSFNATNVNQRLDLGNGTYNIKVISSSGCSDFPVITITLEALNIKNWATQNVKCFGASTGSITVGISGGTTVLSPYKYKWLRNNIEIIGKTSNSLTGIDAGNYRVEVSDDFTMVSKDFIISNEPSAALTATETHTDVVCFDESNGTITLNIQGGTPPYTVAWKDVNDAAKTVIASQLPKGTYSYIITDDNGCTLPSPANITINQNSAITITSITQKQPTTATATDGEITINVTGGNGGYTYMLKKNNITTSYTASPITGLGDGVYEVSVKDNKNCTTAIQTITLKALAVALVSKVDVTCYGANTGSIEVLASGGTPIAPNQYTYTWFYKQKATDTYLTLASQSTNKAVSLYAGFYKVIVTDNVNISREVEFAELTQRPAITCTFTKTEVNCFNGNDGTITLNIGGGTGAYTVIWKDVNDAAKTVNPTQLTAGNYTFSITDANGCIFPTTPVAITQPLKALDISLLNKVDASGFGLLNGSLEVVAVDGTGPYTYQWYQGAAKTIMTGKTNTLLNGIGAGDYTVVATDKNLCKKDMSFTVLQPAELLITAINEIESIKCNTYKEAVLKATISGGAPIGVADADKNYIYKWYNELQPTVVVSTTNPSETLVAGRYFLVVSDGFGNSYTSTKVTVSEPTPIKITYTQTNVSCKNQQDGSIHITTTGGTGAHTITWSKISDPDPNSISNLFAGNYSVTVRDANNCTATQNFVITEPEILAINKVVKTPPSAEGVDDASIAVTVQGGTANYNFQWYDQNMNLIYTDNNKASNTSIYNIYAGQYFISVTDANGCQITMRDLDKVDPLFIDVVQINSVQCHGDATASIKALTSGGLPGYTYKWYEITNPAVVVGQAETLINAKAGTYYVIATDSFNKSIQSQNITITEPTLLTNSLSAEYVRCGDGNDWTIVSNVQEGTAPYTYLWNTGAKTPNLVNTVSGNYTLTVTDKNGCIVVKSINLVTPEHLSATKVIKIPTCYGGSDATIVVTTHAGIAPFTYLWNTGEKSNTLSNANAGTYSVEITDSKGCIIIETYIIENPPKDVIDLGEDVTLCFDQTLTINATIADDQATYSWTSDKGFKSNKAMITVSEPANYTVVVTNKLGCQATDTIKISSQNTAISAEFAVSSQVFKNEKIIVVDISNPANDEIEWVLPANAKVYSKDKDYAELSFDTIGEYEITLNTKKGNCTATQTKQILVTEGEYEDPDSEINPNEKKFDLKIYPNPSKGIFTVDVTLDKAMKASIKVYNLSNNKLIDSKTEDGRDNYLFDFNLSSLPTGIYFVLFESQQGNKLRKIIIQ